MKVWLYARLSKDEDAEQNSLQNQEKICRAFALRQGHTIEGSSADDNISGMQFSRRGLDEISAAAEAGRMEAVIVKDLSRLGRHKTQTALYIDYLRERGVRVLSVTEGLDTFQDSDDLVIGVRGLMNDYYAKDIGKKVRAGYRQKQKEGIVIVPPFGYWKDKNTVRIQVDAKAAQSVQEIFSLYLEGCGLKEIARWLNAHERKTPAQLQKERYDRSYTKLHGYVWTYTSVKNILTDVSYTGILVNHKRETQDGKTTELPPEQWIFHEGVYPVLVPKSQWEQVQNRLAKTKRTASGNKATHRYAGLLVCGECGNPFVPKKRVWNGKVRVEYVCKGYHKSGKSACTPHRIHEAELDQQVQTLAQTLREQWISEQKELSQKQKMWALKEPILDAHIFALQEKIKQLENEIDEILMEKIKKEN